MTKRLVVSALTGAMIVGALLGCSPMNRQQNAAVQAQAATQPAVSRAQVAQGIYELVYSNKQGVLFVASAGSFSDDSVPYQILVVNPVDLSVVQRITLPMKAFSLALDDAANRLYVGNTGQGAVTIIDTQNLRALQTLQLAALRMGEDGKERPEYHFRQLQLDPAKHTLYMPAFNNTESELFVIDTEQGSVTKTIPGFGFTATGIALDSEGERLYVSNMEGEVVVVDTRSNTIVKRFPLGVEQPLNLAYDAEHHRLLAVDQGHPKMREFQRRGIPGYVSQHPGHRVVAVDLNTEKIIAELEAAGPINLKLDLEHGRLLVTNRQSGEVTVFDSSDYRKLYSISLPDHPNTLAVNSRTGEVYVSVKNGESVPQGTADSVASIRF